jgi:hypothetical protein
VIPPSQRGSCLACDAAHQPHKETVRVPRSYLVARRRADLCDHPSAPVRRTALSTAPLAIGSHRHGPAYRDGAGVSAALGRAPPPSRRPASRWCVLRPRRCSDNRPAVPRSQRGGGEGRARASRHHGSDRDRPVQRRRLGPPPGDPRVAATPAHEEGCQLYAVRLTPEGRRMLALAAPALQATDESLLSTLSPPQRNVFRKALQVLMGASA